MPRTKKPKRVVLSSYELRLLANPPTETTWICAECDFPNAGKTTSCWLCRTKQPAKPTLLWPDYVKACKKLQLTPGSGRWKKVNAQSALFYDSEQGKWIDADVPYEGEPTLIVENLVSEKPTNKPVVTKRAKSSLR